MNSDALSFSLILQNELVCVCVHVDCVGRTRGTANVDVRVHAGICMCISSSCVNDVAVEDDRPSAVDIYGSRWVEED